MAKTLSSTPIWPALLDHLCLDTPRPEEMRRFYRDGLGLEERALGAGQWLLNGRGRRVLLREAEVSSLGYSGFTLDEARLTALSARIEAEGVETVAPVSPLYRQGAFAVADPDGNLFNFGVAHDSESGGQGVAGEIDGRLQHVVVATADLPRLMDFYERVLGFVASDYVRSDDGAITAAFYRSDPEHHSLACFRAPEPRLDHHCYETPSWNHIRDWADHFATLEIPIWWGPGRHGAGNNLFFMVLDPDGNKVEFSAELEHIEIDVPAREWPHDQRTLNLWGNAWMRS